MAKTYFSKKKAYRRILHLKPAAFLWLAAAILLSAVLLSACGASGASGAGERNMILSETTVGAPAMAPLGGTMSEVAEDATIAPEAMTNGSSYDSVSGMESSGMPEISANPASTNRKLIRTVELRVEATDFDGLLRDMNDAVSSMGGYMEQSDISGSSISASPDSRRFAYLTVRIPSDQLDSFVSQVGAKGNITNKSESVQDVTLQYSDIESRKKTLLVEQDKLWELLVAADSMDAVIALESRLSEIRYQLESMESQLRLYDNQVDYSTVRLYIDEVKVFTPTAPDSAMARIQKGFSRNLQSVGEGLVNFAVWFLSSLPSLALLAIIILAAVFIIRRFIKRFSGKKLNLPPDTPLTEKMNMKKKETKEKEKAD
ncbi:MAG: DUF4349 domain-containing protein [Eubacteriales bacterium]|nr:DUF4349 domain-containing protein [Eubacteriales bacterium]